MEPKQNNPFLSSAIIVAFIISFIVTVVSLFMGYRTIGSEPTGSFFSPMMYVGILACFVGLFAGLLSVRHHVNMFNEPLKLGRGAVIGLTSGLFVALFGTVFSLLWMMVDPGYTDRLMEAMIRQMESISGMPEGQLEPAIDGIHEQFQGMKTFAGQLKSFAINACIMGALNAITGMLGVKFFAPKEARDTL